MLPPVPASAPAFVKDVLGDDDRQPRRRPAGQRHAGRRHVPHRHHACTRSGASPRTFPSGTPRICIQCGLCSLVCPHASIRMKAYEPELLAEAPQGFMAADWKGKEYPGWKFTIQVVARRLHRLRPVRRRLPGQEQGAWPSTRPSTCSPRWTTWSASRRTSSSSSRCPRSTAAGQDRHRQGLAALAAAVRVLRGLRRLRRNALRQAAHAVLRRPDADRQRHRLLVDLRRQSALHALHGRTQDGTGPTWSNSLFEDCAEFGFGFRLADRSADRLRQRAAEAACRPVGRRAGRRRC